MAYIWVYLAALVAFLVADGIWLNAVMRPLFERTLGDMMRDSFMMTAAAGFYLVYLLGVVYFCVLPALAQGSLTVALVNGLFLGLLAYGTYEFTSMAIMKRWTLTMVVTDTAGGMVMTAITALVATAVGRTLGLGG